MVLGVTNKHVQNEREEAQKVCCGVQIDSVELILEVEKYKIACVGKTAAEQSCLLTIAESISALKLSARAIL